MREREGPKTNRAGKQIWQWSVVLSAKLITLQIESISRKESQARQTDRLREREKDEMKTKRQKANKLGVGGNEIA